MKKYADEGPSNKPPLVSEISPVSEEETENGDELEDSAVLEESENSMASEDLEALEMDSGSEYDFPTPEALRKYEYKSMEGRLVSPKVSKPRPLNLTDDFEVIGGVPTVILKSEKGKESLDGYVFSSDGSRMATRYIQGIVKVYDVLNNFSFVASYQFGTPIKFLDFWNRQNDVLVVVLWHRKVHLVSVKRTVKTKDPSSQDKLETIISSQHDSENVSSRGEIKNGSSQDQSESDSSQYGSADDLSHDEVENGLSHDETEKNEVEVVQSFKILHPNKRSHFNAIEVDNSETTLWIVERELCLDKTLLLTIVCEDAGVHRIKIYCGFDIWPSTFWLSISKNMIIAIVETDKRKTKILKDIEVKEAEMKIDPIEIYGRCIAMSSDGNQFAIWREDEDGMSFVDVHFHKDLKHGLTDTLSPSYSIELTFGLVNIRGEFLHEPLAPSDNLKIELKELLLEQEDDLPELALVVSKSNGVNFLVFDPKRKNIIKEVDLTPEKNELEDVLDIEYSLSRNMRWVAIIHHQNNTLNLFSFTSGSLIWSSSLEGMYGKSLVRGNLQFSCSDSALCLSSKGFFLAFFPQCFATKKELQPEVVSISFEDDLRTLSSAIDIVHRQLPKPFLFSLSKQVLPKGFLDIACSRTFSKVAIAMKVNTKVQIFVKSSFEEILSKGLNTLTDESQPEKDLNGESKMLVEELEVEMDEAIHVFLYPNKKEGNNESIVVFSTHPSLKASFIDFDKNSQTSIEFDDRRRYWYGIKQSSNGLNVACVGLKSVWVVDLNQRCVTHKVEYKFWTFYWLQLLKICGFDFSYNSRQDEYKIKIVGFDNKENTRYISFDKRIYVFEDRFQTLALLFKKHSIYDISFDGASVSLGLNVMHGNRFVVTKDTTMEDIIELKQDEIVPCWALSDDFEQVAFLRSDERGYINEVCIYNHQSKLLRSITKREWNTAQTREMTSAILDNMKGINFHLDKDKGTLSVQVRKFNGHVLYALFS